ncbi:MAG: NAD-dependent epimerase/dehydratase family protein [Mariniphaga sp.]
MKTAIIAGATGLIGKELLQKLVNSDQYNPIYVITRRTIGLDDKKIRELVTEFENISQLTFEVPVDDVFCTLGSTIRKAGSRENFKKVDYEYVVSLANLGKISGATKFIVVSATGANQKSTVFYNQVKGMTEETLKQIGFNELVILQPSLLLGKRPEFRLAEKIAAIFMKILNVLIPDNYKAVSAEKVAGCMVKMALQTNHPVSIIKSGEILKGC